VQQGPPDRVRRLPIADLDRKRERLEANLRKVTRELEAWTALDANDGVKPKLTLGILSELMEQALLAANESVVPLAS
jgi:hypothetical protein